MQINGTVLKQKTLWFIGVIAAGSLAVQEEWIKDHVIPLLANHPHLSTLGGGLLVILSALHNPDALTIAGQILAVPPGTEAKQETKLVTPADAQNSQFQGALSTGTPEPTAKQ
jgi:hypothetical protein